MKGTLFHPKTLDNIDFAESDNELYFGSKATFLLCLSVSNHSSSSLSTRKKKTNASNARQWGNPQETCVPNGEDTCHITRKNCRQYTLTREERDEYEESHFMTFGYFSGYFLLPFSDGD